MLFALCSFAIIVLGKRELFTFLCLQGDIVVFPNHTHNLDVQTAQWYAIILDTKERMNAMFLIHLTLPCGLTV